MTAKSKRNPPVALEAGDAQSPYLSIAICSTSLVLMLLIAVPFLMGQVYTVGDLRVFYMPMRYFYAQCLAQGDSPLWWPNLYGGYDLHGAGQVGMLHPLHFLLYKFLPFTLAYDLELLVGYPMMFAGMVLFLRRLSLRLDCALFGAMLFTFSTFNIHRLIHLNALQIMAHVPWVLYCVDLVAREAERRVAIWAAVILGVLNASQLLLGYPQYYWFSSLAVAWYVLYLLWRREVNVKRLSMLVAATALGVMAAGIQLLPTMESLELSVRKLSPHWDADEVYAGSTDPKYLMQGLAPYIIKASHKQRIYAGAVPLFLSLWAVLRFKRLGEARSLIIGSAILAVLMVWLATGRFGYLYELQTHLPFVGSFRYPSRYVHLLGLAMAILGAFALQDLLTRKDAAEWRSLLPAASLICALVLLSLAITTFAFWRHSHDPKQFEQVQKAPALVLIGPVLMAFGAAAVLLAARGTRWAAVLLVVVTAADAGYYGMRYSVFGAQCHQTLNAMIAGLSTPPGQPAGRIIGGKLRGINPAAMKGWKRLDGFEGLPPNRVLDYRELAARRIAGLKWAYAGKSAVLHGFAAEHDNAIYDPAVPAGFSGEREGNWKAVSLALPRVRCVASAVVSASPADAANALANIDVASNAVVEVDPELVEGAPGKVTLKSDRPGHLEMGVDCATRQLLVVSESYHPGWQVRIDDEPPQPALRVNGDFMGVAIDRGSHKVELIFAPHSFRRGMMLTLAGALGLVLWAASTVVMRKKSVADAASV